MYQFSHEFMADWQAYAAQGYAVVAINPRGSSGRGFDFARAIYADWGNVDVRDVLAGRRPRRRAWASPTRSGWAGRLELRRHPHQRGDRARHTLQGRDQRRRRVQHVRRCTGTTSTCASTRWSSARRGDDREQYDRASYPFLHADRITTPTMFQCAEADFNVPCLGAEQMYQALRRANVPTQLVVYPGENHQLTVPSYLRDRLKRNLAWYDRFLKA